MTSFWPLALHSGLGGHDRLMQLLAIALIAGLWLVAAGRIERLRLTARRHSLPSNGNRA